MVGEEYSACVTGSGGSPWLGSTRPGKTSKGGKTRYWEFPFKTLESRTATDSVDFKKKDDAIPALKVYLGDADTTPLNQVSVWLGKGRSDEDPFGVGYGQDAKKELQALVEAGIVERIIGTSKPSALMWRLIALFTRPGSLAVDIGSPAAEMATAAITANRNTVYAEMPSNADYRGALLLPRLTHSAKGSAPVPTGVFFSEGGSTDGEDEPARGFFVEGRRRPTDPTAGLSVFELANQFVDIDRELGLARIDYDRYRGSTPEFLQALASIEGLLPALPVTVNWFAQDIAGGIRAAYVASSDYLDSTVIGKLRAEHSGHIRRGGKLRIYYHRGLGLLDVVGRRDYPAQAHPL